MVDLVHVRERLPESASAVAKDGLRAEPRAIVKKFVRSRSVAVD